jgi:selenocysteine lyase/cysteine desulfurase
MDIITEVGPDAIRARNQELTAEVITAADDAGLEVLTPRDERRRGGLVRVRIPGGEEVAEKALRALFERDVVVDQRSDALRISPHFFNNEEDIERCFEQLTEVL